MVGAAVSESERFNLIGMWVEPAARGSGIAKELVDIIKARSTERGFDGVFWMSLLKTLEPQASI